MSRSVPRLRILIAALVLFSLAPQARAAELDAAQRMKLLLRVLAYDRQLSSRQSGGAVLVGVAFAPGDAASVKEKDAVLAALGAMKAMKVSGLALAYAPVPYAGAAAVGAPIGGRRAAALYVCGGLGAATREIAAAAARAKIATMSGSELLTRDGLAFAAFADGGGSRLIVNLQAAKDQGLDLDAAVLKLAIVVRGGADAAGGAAAAGAPVFQDSKEARKRRVAGSEPEYPNRALVQGWEATLVANVFISAAGAVEKIQFLETDKNFEETVRKAVAKWRFKPHVVGGKPVATFTKMRFAFQLD